MTIRTEHFEGDGLAADTWVPHYLPHWSSRERSRASYDVSGSVLRLHIPVEQGLWCPERHTPALRTSTIASGLYAGPRGSTVGQQPFAEGLTVTEEQDPFRGWLLAGGRLTVRARADLSARSMVSVWLTGFEDEPERCGEVCVFEVFGDTVTADSAGVGAGVHAFRDPALREDFSVTTLPLDLREWHDFSVEMGPGGCSWSVDGRVLRTSEQCPTYPLQLFVGVFDFPDRDDGTLGDHVPSFEVDLIEHVGA
ncbi:glycoside hydrolase family 16 protein [Nocardioides sp. SYSU D00065]|uniref:glycoside hydrolase family 16 protein n=1 Tax=Nocardioides sp. SYSU D00065 TaxID=2817378 RepID=UPI001B339C3D|nr:glycoside hydrolase family 16 protein [Nocardioides sp. SYSU D00065]